MDRDFGGKQCSWEQEMKVSSKTNCLTLQQTNITYGKKLGCMYMYVSYMFENKSSQHTFLTGTINLKQTKKSQHTRYILMQIFFFI